VKSRLHETDLQRATADAVRPWNELKDAQREQFILDHLWQVQCIARRIHGRLPRQIPIDDLIQCGVLGLMAALRRFDPKKNVELRHYAEFRIRGAILDSLREADWGPRKLRRQARMIKQAIAKYNACAGRDPDELELATELGMRLEVLQHLRGNLYALDLGSLQSEGTYSESKGAPLARAICEEDDPCHQAMRSELFVVLGKAMGSLMEQERAVLTLYYFEELTMRKVGAVLGICESRVSQIHSAGLLQLRTKLRGLNRSDRGRKESTQLRVLS
jgi:RNA polymerase sigma factor FliA